MILAMLTLLLSKIPDDLVVGSYGPNDSKAKPRLKYDQLKAAGSMPERARFLHPLAASSYINHLHPQGVAVSDMFRSAESSLHAVQTGRGAMPPGYSAHNYGAAIDIRVDDVMKRLRDKGWAVKTKKDLDAWMAERGWFCHRTDSARGPEDWHYNALFLLKDLGFTDKPVVVDPKKFTSTAGWVEELLKKMYRDQFVPDDKDVQVLLKKLGMYSGAVDGVVGPQTKAALGAFQRAWEPEKAAAKLDDRTRRTLAFVAAEKNLVSVPNPA
jgi:hypothetical protein